MILNKLKKFIKTFKLLSKGNKLILGVSGGSDSVGLLYMLSELKELELTIIVAHINHKLRGEESDGDEKFVEKIANELNLVYEPVSVDTILYKNKNKLSLEDAARQQRYEHFEKLLKKYKADCIATAHTLNDQSETLLMRLIRGSGTLGLSGISANNRNYIRPLLNIEKSEIQEYLSSKNISWREDSTNLSDDFLRNKIRNELIPLLKQYNPNIEETLARSALISGFDFDYLNASVEIIYKTIIKELSAGKFGLVEKLMRQPTAIRFGIIRMCIEKTKGDLKSVSAKHLFGIDEVLNSLESSGEIDLPDGIVFYKGHGLFFVGNSDNMDNKYALTIKEPGIWKYSEDLIVEIEMTNDRTDFGEKNVAYLSVNKVDFPLEVCSYREGDRFIPLGMEGYKKVKDYFIDEKFPRFLRNKIPVFKFKGEIVWIGGKRIDERFKAEENEEMFLKIKISGFIDEFQSLLTQVENTIN